ncbi:large conductance mechanosensitive channel protein MscL [uncultured Ruminococcus sp.]|uniref:large conductance mechanosensitive channel protein MscL n=1 Tax=uncultured Ruminococcus sp. TaxID=165186 RepID=UPI000ED5646E|nr:large conductance mechanosensitive channel protein MscL [uncultured Ruminococcus sp.]HCJ41507.1 large conductance mechanosensitive channel protein MscL [Ruminococcus sp.]
MFKKFMTEFKEFALKGNVMDMAIGVIIGAAFGNIVTSLTDNFINPLIAVVTGGAKKDENGVMQVVGGSFKIRGVSFNYGSFVSSVINFLVIALVLFLMLKAVNGAVAKAAALAKKEEEEKEEEPAEPTAEEKLLGEIRDLLTATASPEALAKIEAAKAEAEK